MRTRLHAIRLTWFRKEQIWSWCQRTQYLAYKCASTTFRMGSCVFGKDDGQNLPPDFSTAIDEDVLLGNYNSKLTEKVTKQLVPRGFMIDFAPALEGQIAQGKFFRVVINIQTPRETVERLVQLIDELGRKVAEDLRKEYGRI